MPSERFAADDEKLTALMLYIASRSVDDPFFGAVKLNKILFRADFTAYRLWGRPITGHAYFRLPEGPAPQVLVPVRKRMLAAGQATVEKADVFGREQQRLVAQAAPNLSLFTEEELALVDDLIEAMRPLTAAQVTADSHRFPGWRAAGDREVIPYETAFLSSEATQADISWAIDTASEHGWL